jgi:DNA-binding response OmpR family regulator
MLNQDANGLSKILIVDDEDNIRRLLMVTLSGGRFQLYQANNGVQALEMAAQLKPEFVVLDIMMPGGVNGLEVCRQIKENSALQSTRVILLSALGEKSNRDAGFAAQADAYLVKPFSPIYLLEMIDAMHKKTLGTGYGFAGIA